MKTNLLVGVILLSMLALEASEAHEFLDKSIQQSTPVSGATNTVTMKLKLDVDLPENSTVTITGLTGSQTATSGSLAVTSTSSRLGRTGVWTQGSGQLVLTAESGGTQ